MWTRDCPKCGKEISYSKKGNLTSAIKNNNVCKSCVRKGKPRSEKTSRKISETLKGKPLSEETRRKMSISRGGNGKLDRKWPRHVAWANRVKERDGCCQKCQSTEDLHAHHLIPKSLMPQYYDVDANGITLCQSCHIELHKILR